MTPSTVDERQPHRDDYSNTHDDSTVCVYSAASGSLHRFKQIVTVPYSAGMTAVPQTGTGMSQHHRSSPADTGRNSACQGRRHLLLRTVTAAAAVMAAELPLSRR
jgi:hypothetical protein